FNEREQLILRMLSEGLSPPRIAQEPGTSKFTVTWNMKNIEDRILLYKENKGMRHRKQLLHSNYHLYGDKLALLRPIDSYQQALVRHSLVTKIRNNDLRMCVERSFAENKIYTIKDLW